MGYVRITDRPEELFHYTRRDNLASILRDGRIKRMGDAECWFCSTLDDTLELMRDTVMVEGKPYVKLGGSIGRYPKFQPEDYVILRLKPRYQNGEWVRWMQEMPPGTPPELLKAAENFSMGTSIPSVNPMVFKKCWRFRFPLSDNQRLIISPHAKGSRYCLRRIDWPQETGILAMVIKNQRLMSMFLCAKCSSNILTASHRTAALVVKAEN